MQILRDLTTPRQQESWAEQCRQRLREDNYGTEWCLTDVLREPNRNVRARVLDALQGIGAGGRVDPAKRSRVMIAMRRIGHGTITRSQVVGDPEVVTYDKEGVVVMQPGPQQIEYAALPLPERWTVPIVSDDLLHSGMWLLRNHGWMAKDVGKVRRRFSHVGVRTLVNGREMITSMRVVDHWVLVEEAFEAMYPELAAPRVRSIADPQQTYAVMTTTTTSAPKPRRGRPPKRKRAEKIEAAQT